MEKRSDGIMKLSEKVKIVTQSFYQQQNEQGYQLLIELIDMIIEFLNKYENVNTQEANELLNNKLANSCNEIIEALENKDNVLIADILNYDILEILSQEL